MKERARDPLPQGAELVESGVRYRLWAPEKHTIEARIERAAGGPARTLVLVPDAAGFHSAIDPRGAAGDRYQYLADGAGPFPDPASRAQPDGVHGASMVVDPRAYPWRDAGWRCPPLRDLVLYEIHVGTFTPEGTFRAVTDRLPYLRELGIGALQLMPVADFPGDRNWGYDGVSLFAPARCYGSPDDLRALVDAAHAHGLGALLDVVYNHLGPDGNYLGAFSRFYFNDARQTPWGSSLNLDGERSAEVRAHFIANAGYWLDEFHFDGLRLDATHAILDESERHLLAEIADAAHRRGAFVIAEDERNLATLIAPDGHNLDAVYADDFCHSVQVALGDAGYADDFDGSAGELADELRHGWHYRGRQSARLGGPRGTECGELPPGRFAICIDNHDQSGNRAFGQRLHQLASPAAWRAASALLLLAPYTPMLFMGQEWGASTPFLYFTAHHDALGRLVTEGRRREFARFAEFRDPGIARTIPDPQSRETFTRSQLDWSEPARAPHAALLALYRECLRLRAADPAFRPASRGGWEVPESGVPALRLRSARGEWLILAQLATARLTQPLPAADWRCVFSSNEARFGGDGSCSFDPAACCAEFNGPELLALHAAP